MKKIRRLSLVLFIFSVLAFSYPVTQVFAQGGGQCDSNPACNPASGTCCGQCDPSPACNPNDPNGIPCCGLEGNNMTNGSQPPGGFKPPRRPLKKNDLDPRLVQEMEKMKHELEACRSLKEEIRGQQQTARRQAPAPTPTQTQCQPDTAMQRQLEDTTQKFEEMCRLLAKEGLGDGAYKTMKLLEGLLTGVNPTRNIQHTNAYLDGMATRALGYLQSMVEICEDAGKLGRRPQTGTYIYIQ